MTKLDARILSFGTAALVGASLVAAAGLPPLPGLCLVGFLVLVAEEDVRRRRISNRLTFPAFAVALGCAAWTAGLEGLVSALAGALVGLAVLALPFGLRWIGGGDVKAVMVLGAFAGPVLTLELLFWITVTGGVLGAASLAAQGGLSDLVLRWWVSALVSLSSRGFCYVAPTPGSAAASGLPFGIAMGFGVAACQIWGSKCLA